MELKMSVNVVFHIDEKEKWKLLIGNVKNLCRTINTRESRVEILVNSLAVELLKKGRSSSSRELNELNRSGVKICACRNSLEGMDINPDDLYDFIHIVPIGVRELIDRQADGFAYIKP